MAEKTKLRLAVIAFTVAAVTLAAAPAQATDHTETQTLLEQYRAQTGLGAAVYAGDATEAWALSSGTAQPMRNRPITEDDHFRIASQTKTFTATVVMQLVDEGAAQLDAPIGRYLPGVVESDSVDGDAITVRQILQHTSGLPRDPVNPVSEPDGTYTEAELVRSALTQEPQFAPGTGWGYSNVNYLVAGMLVETLTGQTISAAITERIIEPLSLTETTFPEPGDRSLAEPYLPGYLGVRIGGVLFWSEATFARELSWWSGAGAMSSTMSDIAEFYQALLAGDVVSEESLEAMQTTVPSTIPEQEFGLGLIRWELSCGGEAWGHAGDLPTGHTSATLATEDGRSASIVTNLYVDRATSPSRGEVLDAALCEGASA
jgi:D-alanyl-D-alanine carboxypeptidase